MRNDIRYALRTLLRERGFAAMVVLSLAVGIGANTAIFSVINGVLLRPLPYRDPERLFTIREVVPKLAHLYPSLPVNLNHYLEWRKRCAALESIAIVNPSATNLTGAGEPERLTGARVSANAFGVLGINPQRGRGFLLDRRTRRAGQCGCHLRFAVEAALPRDPGMVGRKILLDGGPKLIVGVLSPGFQFPGPDDQPDVFKPLGYSTDDLEEIEGDFNYDAIARLRPGVAPRKALAELNVIQADISTRMPEKMDMRVAMTSLHEEITGHVQRGLLVLLGAVGTVLLILCVNLANLSLARTAGRARESAIRTALGAGRMQMVRQTLTESVLLALLGGTLGIALAWWGVHLLVRAAPADLPLLSAVRLDGSVLSFASLISLSTGLIFGVLPALRSAGAEPREALKSVSYSTTESRRGMRVRDLLVGAEAALSAMLLITAGLLTGSFVRLMHVDKGFDIERVLAVRVSLPSTKYTQNPQMAAFFERVLEGTRALPGVLSASFVSSLPLQGETWVDLVAPENDQRPLFERPMVNVRFVTPGYFQTLRIPLREGRPSTTASDGAKSQSSRRGRRGACGQARARSAGACCTTRKPSRWSGVPRIFAAPAWTKTLSRSSTFPPGSAPAGGFAASAHRRGPAGHRGRVRETVRHVDADVPVPQMRTCSR